MRRVKKENGFTLIEILIATAITAIVMIAGTAFIAKFARTSASFAEDHELEESRGTLAGILRSDFDGAGRNLTRPSAPGAGKETVSFLPVPDYSVDTPGRATRLTTETGAYASTTSTRAITAGGSVWEFTPSSRSAVIVGLLSMAAMAQQDRWPLILLPQLPQRSSSMKMAPMPQRLSA